VTETFERGYLLNEYQYTLYYYDRSGNLVHTVPPASVQVLSGTPLTNAVNAVTNTSGIPAVYPAHSLNQSTGINSYVSHYGYTTFDAPTKQITPDAGETIYFYDHVGRLVASQSFKQQNLNLYSYTKYDDYGRITEVGELVVGTGIGTSLTNAITANPGQWQAYLSAYLKREVSFTYYDEPLNATTNAYFTGGQKNLRTRVSATTYEQVSDNNHNTFDHGNFYTYDDHGNVNQLITEKAGGFRGVVDYEYDLVSGNVNKVVYNKTKAEALYHKYCYDNDNRLKEVYTSTNGHVYQKDAKYFYYQHGPMARTELGEKQVQAADYAFTIQGWVKAVNSNALATSTDMGKDGENTTAYLSSQAGLHRNFAKDAAGYSLNYFGGDYNPIKAAAGNFLADLTSLNNASATGFKLSADAPDLYNGNISSMVTSIYDINPLSKDKGLAKPQITGYKYDQLHRIRHMKAYSSLCINTTNAAEHKEAIDLVSNQFNLPQNNSNYIDIYEMDFTYDKLGNIKTLERQGDAVFSGGTYSVKRMDKMTYNYQTAANMNTSIGTIQSTNRLTHVDEDLTIPSGNYPSDIEDQLPNNYIYDNNGQLTQDLNEEIASIEWTVSRKVSKVIRTNTSIKPDIIYQYNAFGQRVYKKVCNKSAPGVVDANSYKETFYNLDASGNVLAIYERVSTVVGVPPLFSLNVQTYCRQEFVYGAGRLGTLNRNIDMSLQLPPSGLNQFGVVFGEKDYELSNHLGNIITTVSDRKRAIDGTYNYVGYAAGNYNFDGYTYSSVSAGTGVFTQVTAPDGVVDAYVADIRTTADYYGFGLTMSARTYAQGGIKYRYGMNGQEKDDEIANGVYTAEYWEYDSRLGRRWNPDPVVKPFESPYACFRNNPIHYSDPSGMDGEEPINGGTLPEIEITASKTTQQKPAWDMTKDKKGNITFSGPYNGKNYSITYNPKKPQEFNISNGTTDIDFDFYTRMPDAKGTSKKSMSLNFEQRSEAKTYSGDKDVGKLKQTLIGTVKVIDVLKEAAKSNPHFGIGIVGNAYLPENTVGGTAVMEVDTKEDPRGYILETQFNDFTQKRADNVKNAFFGDINNVQTYSIDDGLKLGNPNIDPGARNRNNTGITIFLFEATFKPASVRNGD
jgi:RHS repeat-associated protein